MKQDNDGLEVNIGSKADIDDVKRLTDIFKKFDSVSKPVIAFLKKLTNSTSSTVEKLNDVSKAAEEAHKSLSKSPKMSYSDTWKQVNKLKSEYNELKKTVDLYNKTYPKGSTREKYRNEPISKNMTGKEIVAPNMDAAEAKLVTLKKRIEDGENTLKKLREESKKPLPLNLKPAKKDIDKLNEDLEETGRVTEKTGKKFSLFGWLGKKSFDLLKASIRKSLGIFPGIGKLVGNTSDTLFNKFKKLGLGLLAVRTAMSVLTKSVSAYLAFDGALQDSISNSWNMLGSLLAPAIEVVAQLFATATTYVYMFVKALTGIDLVARANAKALKTQAAATKAAGQAQRSLSSMDEITNLQTDSAGGGGAEAPQIEVPKIEPGSIFSDLIEALKNGEWYKAGEIIADGINEALESINWASIQAKARKFGIGMAEFLNGIVDNLNWTLLGSTIGNGIQTAIEYAYGFVTTFHWGKFGKGLADGLMGAIRSINWAMAGKTLHDGLMGLMDTITTFIREMKWEEVGKKLGEFIDNLDLTDLAVRFYTMLKEAFGGFGDFLAGLFNVDPDVMKNAILGATGITLLVVAFKKLSDFLGGSKKMSKSIDDLSKSVKEAGKTFGKAADKFGKAAIIIAVLGGISLVIKSITELFKTFDESSISAGEAMGMLAVTFGAIASTFVILTKAIKGVPISAIVSIVAVLGTLSLTIMSITNLLKVFADSSLSLNDAMSLLLTIFAGLVIMMVAVAAIGPSMTAGLVPFAAVVGLIIATLLVLAATLPTILDAVGKFVSTVAPPLVSIIDAIYNGIGNLIYALGTALPPIINSIGGVFNTIFNGIANVVEKVGNTISKVMKTASSSTSSTLNAILSFINRLGPAVNNLVNNLIRAVTNLVNFVIRAMEHLVNITVVPAANAIIDVVNKAPGINIKKASKVHIPRLATGTNNIEQEGIYHLHEGEAVVPKKYNPATGGYDNGADNKQIIDLLIDLNANMLALSEREMAVYMDSRKVAEGIYNDMQTVTKNKNMSGVMKRS